MVVYSTTDIGHTWQQVGDLGGYGQHYPSILRLHDGRLLLTFTMREPFEPNVFPHGLRAVVGQETEDGFEFDLRHDRIMLDTKGKHARYPESWSGCLGGTVQVEDGTLVSVYAYGGHPDGNASKKIDFDTEIIRWQWRKISENPEGSNLRGSIHSFSVRRPIGKSVIAFRVGEKMADALS